MPERSHAFWFDKSGEPIDAPTADRLLRDPLYRRVGLDVVADLVISTTWLAIDHQFGDGPPILFETMIFDHPGHVGVYQRRCSTEAQASAEHKRIVRKLEDGCPIDTLDDEDDDA